MRNHQQANRISKNRGLVFAGLLLLSTQGWAQSPQPLGDSESDVPEMQDLLTILDELTEIATKTKMNSDYVPGQVTILHGDELEAQGVRTVWEALRLVPGIEPSIDQTGGRQTLVRGVGGNFASGNMKILLNNVSMNSALSANANPVLNMPVEQIEHIEVIRGPGSAIHGEFAYAGLINVITRKTETGAFVRSGSFSTQTLGGYHYWRSDDGKSGGSINLAGWNSDGAAVTTGEDALYNGLNATYSGLSNAPGTTNEEMVQRSLILDWYRDNYTVNLTRITDGNGDHFGTINALTPPDGGIAYRNEYSMLSGTGDWELSPSSSIKARLSWQQYENPFEFDLLPPGFLGIFTQGMSAQGFYDEERLELNLDWHWSGWADHDLLLGLGAVDIEVGDAWIERNFHPITGLPVVPAQRFTQADGLEWPAPGQGRKFNSLTLQDEYRASDVFTLTAGLRYDDYDDVGSNISPRLAAVWRLSRQHILKGQYSRAFRPPTFFEMSLNSDIDPETIKTAEVAYIYRVPNRVMRLTAFRSTLQDMIVNQGILGFQNTDKITLHGLEAEYENRLSNELKFDANLTATTTEQGATGKPVAGAANRLANIVLTYQPGSRHTYTLWVRHVGTRTRESGDVREKLDGYQTLDAAANFFSVGIKSLTLRVGVQNLLDEEVNYPAFMTEDWAGNPIPAYSDDYPRAGRSWWLQMVYRH